MAARPSALMVGASEVVEWEVAQNLASRGIDVIFQVEKGDLLWLAEREQSTAAEPVAGDRSQVAVLSLVRSLADTGACEELVTEACRIADERHTPIETLLFGFSVSVDAHSQSLLELTPRRWAQTVAAALRAPFVVMQAVRTKIPTCRGCIVLVRGPSDQTSAASLGSVVGEGRVMLALAWAAALREKMRVNALVSGFGASSQVLAEALRYLMSDASIRSGQVLRV